MPHYKKDIGNINELSCVTLGGHIPVIRNFITAGVDDGRTVIETQKSILAAGRGGAIGGVTPVYHNWEAGSNTFVAGANEMRIASGIMQLVGGVPANPHPFTMNGQLVPMIGKNGMLIADSGVDFDFTANEQFVIRTSAQVANAGELIVGGTPTSSPLDVRRMHNSSILPLTPSGFCNPTNSRVHNNSSIGSHSPDALAGTASWSLSPSMILGFSERPQPSILVIGDSNAYGGGYDLAGGDGLGATGYIQRGLRQAADGVMANSMWVKSGMSLRVYGAQAAPYLFSGMRFHSHFLNQLSGNSIGLGDSLATMKVQAIIAWRAAKMRKLRVIQLASLPRTTSNANTTVATGWEVGGVRDQFNAWALSVVGQKIDLLGNLSPTGDVCLDHYWTVNDLLESPATNLWLNPAAVTADGIHIIAANIVAAAGRIATLANTLTIEN